MRAGRTLMVCALALGACEARAAGDYDALVRLAQEWRQFEPPAVKGCLPDYGAAAMKAKATDLPVYQRRLQALDPRGWAPPQQVDYRLIEAEMHGLDFDLRVRQPWARDPSFYATVFGERSDVPQHEGAAAAPTIDLFIYRYPLSKADQASLTCLLGAVPALLEQARVNLRASNARDLWVYSTSTLQQQSEVLTALQAGTLTMRTLEGAKHASLEGAEASLRSAVQRARSATDAFIGWIGSEAPKKTGPSGVGKDNYNWYMQHVHLVPYDWDQQVTLLRRELERARTGLALEEFRNRALPPLEPANTPEAWRTLLLGRMQKLTDFLIRSGIVPERDYYRDAMAQQVPEFVPPEQRNFFLQASAREPLGLFSHDYHWIELARMKEEPNHSAIRRLPALYNMFDSRSEGLATAMEETLMQAGLYDDDPRGREIVWIMLANRAARGLASLYVQANQLTLQQAGRFHAQWTPRGWSDPASELVAFEQLLYLRQPGYGTSYITGKFQFERLISDYAAQQQAAGKPFRLAEFFAQMNEAGTIPFTLIEAELVPVPAARGTPVSDALYAPDAPVNPGQPERR
ncbi:MAG TPA: DUF885 family protein [Steroidobacteraceae bacterium]|nr:DUF885 family protein [Steroidobacteraceae bacterium]